MEDNGRKEQNQNRTNQAFRESPSAVEVGETEHHHQEERSTEDATKSDRKKKPPKDVSERWRRMSLSNKLNFVLACLLVGLTLVNVIFFVMQVRDQEGQVAQITKSITDGINSAKATIDSSLSQNRDEMKTILDENRDAINALREQSRESLRDTLAQGQKALNTSIEVSRTDQRAWVSVTGFNLSNEPDLTKPCAVGVEVRNSGKTPALHLSDIATAGLSSGEPNWPAPPYSPGGTPTGSRSVLPPGITNFAFQASCDEVRPEPLALYLKGDVALYVSGIVFYEDIFKASHWMQFCASHKYGRALNEFALCHNWNRIDDAEAPKAQNQP